LAGPASELETVLDRFDRRTTGPLGPGLKLAARKQAVVAGLNVPAVRKVLPPELPPPFTAFKALLETDTATLTVEVGDEIRARADADFEKEGDAKDSADAVGALTTLARLALPSQVKELKKDEKENAPLLLLAQVAGDALKDAKVTRDGSHLRVAAG